MEDNKNCSCGCDDEMINGCGSDCGCGCGDDIEEEIIYVTFDDENDTEVPCVVLGIFDCEEREYIAITPKEQIESEDEAEIYFYRYSEDGDDVKLDEVETDEEWEKVSETFEENYYGPSEDEE